MAHPLAERVRLVASPMKFSQTPLQYRRPPPLLGEHTDEVLHEAGLSPSEVADLRTSGVI
jgi:crotonobetainyl-CoA:carnitine CoA-transferase CaiB-like acyl-CoA transferase